MREMAERYGTVLVVGGEGEKCRLVAEGYGFRDVWYVPLKSSALRRLPSWVIFVVGQHVRADRVPIWAYLSSLMVEPY